MASAGRRLARGAPGMMKRTRRGSRGELSCWADAGSGFASMLVETEETIRAGDEIADLGQSGERGQIAGGEISLARRISAGEQMRPVLFQRLQVCIFQTRHGVIDAIEIDPNAFSQSCRGQAHTVMEARIGRRGGDQDS